MKNHQARIFFKHNDLSYQFLSISVGKDNSFYFHLYEEAGKFLKIYPLKTLEDGRIKIEAIPIATDFIRHKFSFHPSGILHSTARDGTRLKDGYKGIPFDQIEKSNLVLLLYPRKITNMPLAKQKKYGHTLTIRLNQNLEPFTLNFEVFRKTKKEELYLVPRDKYNGPFLIEWKDLNFGLRFYLQHVEGPVMYPDSTIVMKRILN